MVDMLGVGCSHAPVILMPHCGIGSWAASV
ncbi:MAG: hypothetical protein HW397_207 [Dehalococcoidia bacterium]|nr:hypothetical protein [Dehalococcoidia bacterium]